MLQSWIQTFRRSRRIAVPVHVPARKSGIVSRTIELLPATLDHVTELLVPLSIGPDLPVEVLVRVGDRVEAAAVIGRAGASAAADSDGSGRDVSPDGTGAERDFEVGQIAGQPPGDRVGIPVFSPAAGVVVGTALVDSEFGCDIPAVRLRVEGAGLLVVPSAVPGQKGAAVESGGAAEDTPGGPPGDPAGGSKAAPGGNGTQGELSDDGPGLRDVLAEMARLEDLPAALDELGVIAAIGGRYEPLGQVLRRVAGRVNLLLINALQSEPRLGSHSRLTMEATGAIAAGARAILAYLGLARATLLVSGPHVQEDLLRRRLRRSRLRVVPVRTTWPGGEDALVLRRLYGRGSGDGSHECGHGGCLVLPADAVWRAGLSLVHRRPVTCQAITLAGDCMKPGSQRVYMAPVGLTIRDLVGCLQRSGMLRREPRVILLGGPMTGTSVVDASRAVVTRATQAVLLMDHKPQRRTTGCVRCGWCISGCPVGIDPVAILDAIEAGQRAAGRLAARRCIECGVCSYVCPSHLPLAQAARTARRLGAGR